MEMFEQLSDQYNNKNGFDYVLFPVGGGGLASGTLLSSKYFSPKSKRIGVEP
mgnify:CR=1 FL=1